MNILIVSIIVLAFFIVISKLDFFFSDKMKFFAQGFDFGFHVREINALWKLAKECGVEEPLSLFVSEKELNKCIAMYLDSVHSEGTENTFKVQSFLSKLYEFKTRVVLDQDNKRGLEDSRSISEGQRLSIIYKGKGVFQSKVIGNAREIIVMFPHQIDKKTGIPRYLKADDWDGKDVSVYFWRKGDAAYAFDTEVFKSGVFNGVRVLFLKHSFHLDRTQKRQSIRCKCEIYALMFFGSEDGSISNVVGTQDGYKCLLEDISEDGAMIRIGGQGKKNVPLRLQFELNDNVVIMNGIVRGVEYNAKLNQSRMHFECTDIHPAMRNIILSYVYNVMPQEEREINEAMKQVEKDAEIAEEENADDGASVLESTRDPLEGDNLKTVGDLVHSEDEKRRSHPGFNHEEE